MKTDDTGWTTTTVAAAAVVGLLTVLLWWLCQRSCQHIEVNRTIESEARALYRFLSDPNNLSLIHPYTTGIRVEEEREEEGGRKRIQFVWVEEVPFTVKSLVTMTSDPSTHTVVLDITPAGAMFGVQLTWRCHDVSTGAADDPSNTEVTQATNPPHTSTQTTQASRNTDSTQDSQDTTEATETHDTPVSKDDNHTSKGDDRSPAAQTDHATSVQGRSSTLFENHVIVTGPRVLAVTVARFMLTSVQNKLADNLQQHFAHQ